MSCFQIFFADSICECKDIPSQFGRFQQFCTVPKGRDPTYDACLVCKSKGKEKSAVRLFREALGSEFFYLPPFVCRLNSRFYLISIGKYFFLVKVRQWMRTLFKGSFDFQVCHPV